LFAAFAVLPLDCASAIGGALGRLIGPLLGISKRAYDNIKKRAYDNIKKRAYDNIKRALPGLSESEIADIIRGMWRISAASRPNILTSGASVSSNRAGGTRPTASSISTGRSRPAVG
jgi:hypothetical protein